ncbi:MAG: hypothetical protein ACM3PP_00915 [Candidatus Saccharibacteria bacterium]
MSDFLLFNLSGRNIYQNDGKTYLESRSSQFISSFISVLLLSYTVVLWFMITDGVKALMSVLIGLLTLFLWWVVDRTFAWYAMKFNSVIVNEPEADRQVLQLPWLWKANSMSKNHIYICSKCGAVYDENEFDASLLALLSGVAFVGLLYAVRSHVLSLAGMPGWGRVLIALAIIMLGFVLFEMLHWTLIKPTKVALYQPLGTVASNN